MSVSRAGSYPEPPYWPERLTGGAWRGTDRVLAIGLDLFELPYALHCYIADQWPGTCAITFIDDEFIDWWPILDNTDGTRLSRKARSLID